MIIFVTKKCLVGDFTDFTQADNGGVYHKVTCAVFPETVMPEYETAELTLGKSKEDPYAKTVLLDKVGGCCYVDNDTAYSVNEITIYWNSPLIYLLEMYK